MSKSRKEGGFPRGCNNTLLSGWLDWLLHEVLHLPDLQLLAVGDQLRDLHHCHWDWGWITDCGWWLCGWQEGMLFLPWVIRMENLHWHSTDWHSGCKTQTKFYFYYIISFQISYSADSVARRPQCLESCRFRSRNYYVYNTVDNSCVCAQNLPIDLTRIPPELCATNQTFQVLIWLL